MRLLLLSLLLTQTAWAKYRNPVCEIFIAKKEMQKYSYAYQDIKRLLHAKHYEVTLFTANPQYKLGPGRDYLLWTAKKVGSGFAPCKAELKLRRTSIAIRQSSDKVVWQATATRRLPRTSFNGKERCHYAIKDAIAQLPKCEK
jgi:hypothetical protein